MGGGVAIKGLTRQVAEALERSTRRVALHAAAPILGWRAEEVPEAGRYTWPRLPLSLSRPNRKAA
jgi:hypothetical protein